LLETERGGLPNDREKKGERHEIKRNGNLHGRAGPAEAYDVTRENPVKEICGPLDHSEKTGKGDESVPKISLTDADLTF